MVPPLLYQKSKEVNEIDCVDIVDGYDIGDNLVTDFGIWKNQQDE